MVKSTFSKETYEDGEYKMNVEKSDGRITKIVILLPVEGRGDRTLIFQTSEEMKNVVKNLSNFLNVVWESEEKENA